ncbi:hypothetical protein B7Q40_002972 [Salmonella enterica subsp. enterica serovar Java]|uniref:Uncharacterized protein n=2 Tax=Salmonella enterica TaxID=28901 RepID=A0A3R0UBU0_SALER|nr:hypothetical protein [Salmonella enterica subsp. enterica serovar Java]EAO1479308.1 hypothetical protein [Salmonella enterica]HBM0103083.1 hypothetical protein [Salmonella enterica subsp. enterica serovar Wedding]EDU0621615.1 hypothetical protein [Salmonella enterica subsp. enterica serovar Java]EDW0677729.1 hypothetical protein [Salmonella enterica subsp. enterica serovar Java]
MSLQQGIRVRPQRYPDHKRSRMHLQRPSDDRTHFVQILRVKGLVFRIEGETVLHIILLKMGQ